MLTPGDVLFVTAIRLWFSKVTNNVASLGRWVYFLLWCRSWPMIIYPSTNRWSLDLWLVVLLAGLCRFWNHYKMVCGAKLKPGSCGKGEVYNWLSRSFSALVILCLIDSEEYNWARSPTTCLKATCWGLRHPRGKIHLPGVNVNRKELYW